MSFGEEQSPLILQMSENDSIWAKNKFGYKFKFCTDCFKEIIILHKWAFREIGKYPKTFFSSKSRRSFSKERLCSIDTYHWSILRNIEKRVYKKPRSFEQKVYLNKIKLFGVGIFEISFFGRYWPLSVIFRWFWQF